MLYDICEYINETAIGSKKGPIAVLKFREFMNYQQRVSHSGALSVKGITLP